MANRRVIGRQGSGDTKYTVGEERVYGKTGPNGSTMFFDKNGKYLGKSYKSTDGLSSHYINDGKSDN